MKQGIFKITSNKKIARGIFKMTLAGDTSAITAPGQFVNIKLDGFFLRRPISVCDCVGENLTLIYKTVGHGTEQMSRVAAVSAETHPGPVVIAGRVPGRNDSDGRMDQPVLLMWTG